MTRPLVQHAGCGGSVTRKDGVLVCARCSLTLRDQTEWINEKLTFPREKATLVPQSDEASL